ncbi:MAG: hypothetical protein HY731_12235, partial [Candidatus Tectomicrobia bacterium]|nr:hypothetical protein [Candidatus Tectomicrobia bacterium]
MIRHGNVIKSDSGRHIRVDSLIKAGGQGEAYRATDLDTGQLGVLKVFYDRFDRADTLKRLHFLVDQQLDKACPVLRGPTELINRNGTVGHYAPHAPGQSLEEFLSNPSSTFVENLLLAISVTHAVSVLHQRQIAHGDLHADNFLVNKIGAVPQLYAIDLDNFNTPGVPTPGCVGHNLYIAPELRQALAVGKPAIPDICTDRFALGVLLHEILLFKHVAAGADTDEATFQKAMCSGIWLQDPARIDHLSGIVGGYPVEVLNTDLARLFRQSMSLNGRERPSADQWETALCQAIDKVYLCPT